MKGVKSQIIELNLDFYASVDILAKGCEGDAVAYQVCFNTPLTVENKSMMPLNIFEIDNPMTAEENCKLVSQIPPAMQDHLIHLNITENNDSHFKF